MYGGEVVVLPVAQNFTDATLVRAVGGIEIAVSQEVHNLHILFCY